PLRNSPDMIISVRTVVAWVLLIDDEPDAPVVIIRVIIDAVDLIGRRYTRSLQTLLLDLHARGVAEVKVHRIAICQVLNCAPSAIRYVLGERAAAPEVSRRHAAQLTALVVV